MIIDVHNHALPQGAMDLLGRDPTYRVTLEGGHWSGGNHVDFTVTPAFVEAEAKLAELDRHGIDGAVLSAIPPLFYYELPLEPAVRLCRAVNRGLSSLSAQAPDRLWWLANVPMQSAREAARTAQATADAGAVGFHVGSSIGGRRLDDPVFARFWAAAAESGLPVVIHPDSSYDPMPSLTPFYLGNVLGLPIETTIAITRLICAGVLDRHPELRVVLVHGGGFFPYQAGRLRHAISVREELGRTPADPWSYLGQVVVDSITHDAAALRYLIERAGAANVVLGSDLPFDMAPKDPVGLVHQAASSAFNQITAANPQRLFRLEPSPGERVVAAGTTN